MNESIQRLRPLVAPVAARWSAEEGDVVLPHLKLLRQLASRANGGVMGNPLAWWRAWQGKARLESRGRGNDSHVSAWKASEGPAGTEFVRDPAYRHLWRALADVERIPAKSRKKRVVIIGESVARGMLYDPVSNPAKVLQALLDQADDAYEVVDLAKTSLMPGQLVALFRQALKLEPDMLVLFAGNNWNYELHRGPIKPEDGRALADEFRRGLAAYKAEVDRRHVVGIAESVLRAFARAAKQAGIPALVIVPEFNLADWHDDFPVPLMASGSTAEWYALRAEARGAAGAQRWSQVEDFARRMRRIDEGVNPDPGRLLAEAALARGAVSEARSHLEDAKDSVGALFYRSAPRCLGSTQGVLRSARERYGMAVVDVPLLLGAEGIPGRKYFLDYCHMTAEGIAVTMTAVAREVIRACASTRKSDRAGIGQTPAIEPQAAAVAHWLAAIHNAIFNQPEEIVLHHCNAAMALDARSAALLAPYFASRSAIFPDWLDRDLPRACATPNARRILNQEIFAPDGRYFPHGLFEIARQKFSPSWEASCRQQMGERFAPVYESRRIDLLEHRFQCASFHQRPSPHHRGTAPRSEFRFPRPEAGELELALCCRVSDAGEEGRRLTIAIDQQEVWTGRVGAAWQNLTIKIGGEKIAGGDGPTRLLTFDWPHFERPWAELWRRAQRSIDAGEAPEIHPIFGEIHSAVLTW